MLLFAALALSVTQTGPPADQQFSAWAQLNMVDGTVKVSAFRTTRGQHRDFAQKPKEYAPYRWALPVASVKVTFTSDLPTPTVKSVAADGDGQPKPYPIGINGKRSDVASAVAQIDFGKCKPGIYTMNAELDIQGDDRRWTMQAGPYHYYWRPAPKEPVKELLLTSRRSPELQQYALDGDREYGGLFRLLNPTAKAPWAGIQSEKTRVKARFHMGSLLYNRTLRGVVRDSDSVALEKRFLGRPLTLLGSQIGILDDGDNCELFPIGEEKTTIRILSIRRSATPLWQGYLSSQLTGSQNIALQGWFPLYVTFEVTSGPPLAPRDQQTRKGPYIALLPDAWAFERQFGITK